MWRYRCKYCNTIGCTKAYFGETPRKCVPPISQRDEEVMEIAQQNYTSSFEQSVFWLELDQFFRMELSPPQGTPQVDHLCAPFAKYVENAIGLHRIDFVPEEWSRVAFCRLLVLQAAIHFSRTAAALSTYIRSDQSGQYSLADDFVIAFIEIVVDCKGADLQWMEVYLMHAMLATQHDDEERVEDELVLALEHYEFEVYCNTRQFKVDRVMNLVRSIKRVVRVTGTLALLSPLHLNTNLRPEEVTALAAILYLRKIE